MRPVAVSSVLVLIFAGCETARPGGVAINTLPPAYPQAPTWGSKGNGSLANAGDPGAAPTERAAMPDRNVLPAGLKELPASPPPRSFNDADLLGLRSGGGLTSGKAPPPPMPLPDLGGDLPESASDLLLKATTVKSKGDPTPAEDREPEPHAVAPPAARGDADSRSSAVVTPALRVVNTKRFNLGFELRDIGASLSGMELWGTVDGRTWKQYENVQFQPQACVVEVAEEGTHGFVLVPKGGPRPKTGDSPMVWVTVDVTAPAVHMQGVELSLTSQPPALVVLWTARDRNFGPRPITLSYAEHADGPWTTLAGPVPNTGRCEVPVPSNLPHAAFLRVEAADLAGNIGMARTEKVVHVEVPGNEVIRASATLPPTPPPPPPPPPARPKVVIGDIQPAGK